MTAAKAAVLLNPGRDCPLCPRLMALRQQSRALNPDWFNAPVPSWGSPNLARLAIVGLAPGLRGANRTGRPFTGDSAGNLLYATLLKHGFAIGTFAAQIDDGLQLLDCVITNAVRCVPPQNKPQPSEIATCRQFLGATLHNMPNLMCIVALGRVAHESILRVFGRSLRAAPFGHGNVFSLSDSAPLELYDSYHCSRYNTNTGVLTPEMFDEIFSRLRARLSQNDRP